MKSGSCLANEVDCYCVGELILGRNVTVSQKSYLCGASHDIRSSDFTLLSGPIIIGDEAWVAADAFIGPGVNIAEGAVVAARAVVVKDVAAWTVVAGNPAATVGTRPRNASRGSHCPI
jgi:putative colanic acid biosynthesis acetyltransferase WcaF